MGALLTVAWSIIKAQWKVILGAVIALIVAYLVYHWYSGVKAQAYQSGFSAGQADKQKEIDAIQARDAKAAADLNAKIKDLEDQSSAAAATEFELRAKLKAASTQIITKYVQANPQSSQTCGADKPLTGAINQLLQADPSVFDSSGGAQ